jgi:Flp pilus assembly protein TadB
MDSLPVASPSNRFLVPQRDRRWPHVLSVVLLMSSVILLALALVGWPRLQRTSIHYDLIRLRAEVRDLERRERELRLELELERNPTRLAERARQAGLIPPPPEAMTAEPPAGSDP